VSLRVRVSKVNHGCWILIESEDSVRTILNEGHKGYRIAMRS